jgi:hypothetical protein
MKQRFFAGHEKTILLVLLLITAAIAYLPQINRFGYMNDDWYLMYSAGAHGPAAFQDIFSVDRPGRVLVMIPAYMLFGNNPLLYNLSAFLFRVVGAMALLWILNLLWPRNRIITATMSLLFLIYPGFLSQPNAIDYQSHIVGLAAALLSIWLTLKAITPENRLQSILFHLASILLGWLYLSQMEWYISFEFFRWACVFLLSSRIGGTFLEKSTRAIRGAYPSLVIPIVYLTWRLFFFVSERGATDLDRQLEVLKLYPVQTLYHSAVQVIEDLSDVILGAWVIPLSQLTSFIQIWGGILAILIAGLIVFTLFRLEENFISDSTQSPDVTNEALWLGLLTAIAGLIPIALVNREVAFPSYSRYSLVSSVGVAIFIVALVSTIRGRILRYSFLGVLFLIAALTHHANSIQAAQESSVVKNFWWQVAWRVPQLGSRTTLVGNYPAGAIEEDYFIWGPANLIYYPKEDAPEGIQPTIFATLLNKDTTTKILMRERQVMDNRKNIITYPNYRNILILSQPSLKSCVHVVNGLQPEHSSSESDSVRLIGPYSELEHVLADEAPHTPPTIVFGSEPSHGWCYYYEQADLARQRGAWNEVLQIAQETTNKGLKPSDLIEWMPFLQAYALNGKTKEGINIMTEIQPDEYVLQQACQILKSQTIDASVQEILNSQYCISK